MSKYIYFLTYKKDENNYNCRLISVGPKKNELETIVSEMNNNVKRHENDNNIYTLNCFTYNNSDNLHDILISRLEPYLDCLDNKNYIIPLKNLQQIVETTITETEKENINNSNEICFEKTHFSKLLLECKNNLDLFYESEYNKQYYKKLIRLNLIELEKNIIFLKTQFFQEINHNYINNIIESFIKKYIISPIEGKINHVTMYKEFIKYSKTDIDIREFNKLIHTFKNKYSLEEIKIENNRYWKYNGVLQLK